MSSASGADDQAPTTGESKQTTKCQIFIPKIKINVESQGNVFQKNDKNKCDLKWNDEEVLLQRFTLPFNYESS